MGKHAKNASAVKTWRKPRSARELAKTIFLFLDDSLDLIGSTGRNKWGGDTCVGAEIDGESWQADVIVTDWDRTDGKKWVLLDEASRNLLDAWQKSERPAAGFLHSEASAETNALQAKIAEYIEARRRYVAADRAAVNQEDSYWAKHVQPLEDRADSLLKDIRRDVLSRCGFATQHAPPRPVAVHVGDNLVVVAPDPDGTKIPEKDGCIFADSQNLDDVCFVVESADVLGREARAEDIVDDDPEPFVPVARYNRPRNFSDVAEVIQLFFASEFGIYAANVRHEEVPEPHCHIDLGGPPLSAGLLISGRSGLPYLLTEEEEELLLQHRAGGTA